MIDLIIRVVEGLALAAMWFAVIMSLSITIGKLAGLGSRYKDIK